MAIKAGQQCVIYALRCPVSGRVRYVGKTTDPARRLRHHLSEARRLPHLHKSRWITSLLREGLRPTVEVLEIVTTGGWEIAERRWIASFDGLTNSAQGGAGCPVGVGHGHTEESKAKIAATLRGRDAGERNPNARLTEGDVREIRRLRLDGMQGKDVAAMFHTTPANVSLIVTGRAWAHVE